MGLVKEFKEFAMKGNVMDMAVGIIIGGAFGKIISSLVNDVIMPVVSKVSGGADFTEKFIWLGEGEAPATLQAARDSGGAFLGWGSFLQNVIDFLIVAAAIFAMIKMMNSAKKKEEAAPEKTPEDILLLRDIRDSLAK